jgi:hypothetical protein
VRQPLICPCFQPLLFNPLEILANMRLRILSPTRISVHEQTRCLSFTQSFGGGIAVPSINNPSPSKPCSRVLCVGYTFFHCYIVILSTMGFFRRILRALVRRDNTVVPAVCYSECSAYSFQVCLLNFRLQSSHPP